MQITRRKIITATAAIAGMAAIGAGSPAHAKTRLKLAETLPIGYPNTDALVEMRLLVYRC